MPVGSKNGLFLSSSSKGFLDSPGLCFSTDAAIVLGREIIAGVGFVRFSTKDENRGDFWGELGALLVAETRGNGKEVLSLVGIVDELDWLLICAWDSK